MKYFLRVLLVLVLAVGIVFGVYYYTNGKTLPGAQPTHRLTTVTKPPATEKYAARTLLTELKKQDIRLYKSGRTVILEHGSKEFTFENWSSVIDAEEPELYYADFDGDEDKEIVVRGVSGSDEKTGEYVYDIYVLNPSAGKEEAYDVLLVSQDTWRNILNEQIKQELSQLKTSKKFLQLAMTTISREITYDNKTGITKKASYVNYARALQAQDGSYMTLDSFKKNKGLFSITKDNQISADVEITAAYKESAVVQQLGTIKFAIAVTPENKMQIVDKSMYFEPNEEYRVSDPRQTAKTAWSFTRNNSYVPKNGGTIQWAKYSLTLDPSIMTDTADLAGEDTDIKYVKAVTLTESGVTLSASDGFTFAPEPASKGDYSVTVNKGSGDEYEISYTLSLSKDHKTAVITFDKTYDESKIRTIDISYGSK